MLVSRCISTGNRSGRTLAATLAAGIMLAAAPAQAQARRADELIGPPSELGPRRGAAPPPLQLTVERSYTVPGPARVGEPVVTFDGAAYLPTAGQIVRVDLETGDTERLDVVGPVESSEPAERRTAADRADAHLGLTADGRFRYRTQRDPPTVAVEKRCGWCRDGFRTLWRLRVPGTSEPRALAIGRTLYFGASDNRVYAVRLRNGHRRWVSEISGRIRWPLVLWSGSFPSSPEHDLAIAETPALRTELLLIVPAHREELVAIDPYDGSEVARFAPRGPGARLTGPPTVLPDGRIVVPWQAFDAADAGISVLRFRPTAATKPPAGGPESDAPRPAPDDGDTPGVEPEPSPMAYNAAVFPVDDREPALEG